MSKNLPIKVILQREKDIAKNIAGGSTKIFREVNPIFVNHIKMQLNSLLDFYNDLFSKSIDVPAIAKITLRDDAVAKTHRPNDFCKDLDIIGAKSLNQIFIKVTPQGIANTIDRISKDSLSNKLKANLSTLVSIKPFRDEEKLYISKNDLENNESSSFEKIKIKLFKFDNEFDDMKVRKYVFDCLKSLGYTSVSMSKYGANLEFITVNDLKKSDIEEIVKINGIKKIDLFHRYTIPKLHQNKITNIVKQITTDTTIDSDLIVGVIDSGISDIKGISKFIVGRKEYVPAMYQNRNHGTFVASSILFGSTLDNVSEADSKHFKLFDVIAIPNDDPKYGPTDTLSQDDLFEIIEEVMTEKSNEIKIWNLSLGTDTIVDDDDISDIAIFCDYIQDKYDVQFIIAAGNYVDFPLRTWPTNIASNIDRITCPADSVRAITVGSIALRDSIDSMVNTNEPSSFSRKGPGPNYMVKPELVDYGGNIDCSRGCKNIGVYGYDENNNIVEDIGTSFSTPRISYKYAKILDELVENDLLMAKGFIIHEARTNTKNVDMESEDVKYYGFGHPSMDPQNILGCTDNEITMVFKQKVTKGTHLEMYDFPYPKSLIKNNKYTGEIFMTLIHNPVVDERYGSQYCRVNFDASFGTYSIDEETGEVRYNGQVPLEKNWDELYERSRVENGFKWSPIKSYYRKIKNGISLSDGWKIRIDMHERSKLDINTHEFLLIVTIRGNEDDNMVYNDVVVELQNRGFITVNLETRQQVRERL